MTVLDFAKILRDATFVADTEAHDRLGKHLPRLYLFSEVGAMTGVACLCGATMGLNAWKTHLEFVWRDA